MKNLGTPKSLSEAIANGMTMTPLCKIHQSVELAVKDYIRQILCIQFLRHGENPEIMNVLYQLEAQLGCKMNELESKHIDKNLKSILSNALKVSGG